VEKASCVVSFAAVREQPEQGATQLTQALFADPLAVRARDDGWAHVELPDGAQGYLQASEVGEPLKKDRAHVVVVPQAADRYLGTWLVAPGLRTEPLAAARRKASGDAVAEAALMFLGARYEPGGVTVEGIDCSGLVQVVHRRFGLLLPHSARGLADAGQPVASLEEAIAGDLVLYGDHVAIWLGGGRIVHASKTHGKVVEERQPEELGERAVTVRRIYEPED
jgi:gamma-D-glutamyl-L-lysine dipeptidyl-peptidase